MLTETPGMTAPCVSTTAPWSVAVDWAHARPDTPSRTMTNASTDTLTKRVRLIIQPPRACKRKTEGDYREALAAGIRCSSLNSCKGGRPYAPSPDSRIEKQKGATGLPIAPPNTAD